MDRNTADDNRLEAEDLFALLRQKLEDGVEVAVADIPHFAAAMSLQELPDSYTGNQLVAHCKYVVDSSAVLGEIAGTPVVAVEGMRN